MAPAEVEHGKGEQKNKAKKYKEDEQDEGTGRRKKKKEEKEKKRSDGRTRYTIGGKIQTGGAASCSGREASRVGCRVHLLHARSKEEEPQE